MDQKTLTESFTPEEVKDVLDTLKINHDLVSINEMQHGHRSSLIDLTLPDGTIKEAKISLDRTKEGSVNILFDYKKEKLEIPEKILGSKLTKDEKKALENDQSIIKKSGKHEFVLKVDRDLNKVTVSTTKQMAIPEEIGGYKLNQEDKHNLANGKQMDPKVLFDPKTGNHILANVEISPDGNGLTIKNITPVAKKDVEAKIQQYNVQTDKRIEAATNIGSAAIDNTLDKNTEVKQEVNTATNIGADSVEKAVDQKTEQTQTVVTDTSEEVAQIKEEYAAEKLAQHNENNKDYDMDGTPDKNDHEPGTPGMIDTDANGQALDSDKDGVQDIDDKEPNKNNFITKHEEQKLYKDIANGEVGVIKETMEKFTPAQRSKILNSQGVQTALMPKDTPSKSMLTRAIKGEGSAIKVDLSETKEKEKIKEKTKELKQKVKAQQEEKKQKAKGRSKAKKPSM